MENAGGEKLKQKKALVEKLQKVDAAGLLGFSSSSIQVYCNFLIQDLHRTWFYFVFCGLNNTLCYCASFAFAQIRLFEMITWYDLESALSYALAS
jgi:hypothetical protein